MDNKPDTMEEFKEEQIKHSRNKIHYHWSDYCMGAVLLLAAKYYVSMLLPGLIVTPISAENGMVVFTLLFLAAGVGFLAVNKRRLTAESKISLVFVLLGMGWFCMKYITGNQDWESQDIMPYITLFLHGAGVYWVLSLGESRLSAGLGEKSIIDMFRGFFVLPFMYFFRLGDLIFDLFRRLVAIRGGKNEAETTRHKQIYIGILASVPVLCVILPMLAAADESFGAFLSGTSSMVRDVFFSMLEIDIILCNLLTLMVGGYLFGLFYGSLYEKQPKPLKKTELPYAGLITFISVICGVYLLFFSVKLADVAGVMFLRSTGVVYSSYAREGFFELCFIAVLNFCLYCGVKLFSNPAHRAVRFMQTMLCVQTLCFIALAFSKMSLYISVYGFTFKRVLTSWLMCVLFFLFSLLIRGLWEKKDAIGPAVIFASVTFLMLAYSDMDYWMLWVNNRMGLL